MMWKYQNDYYSCGGGDFISHFLWWILLAVIVYAFIKWILRMDKHGHGGGAVSILRERFAKGEIDKKEYEDRLKELTK